MTTISFVIPTYNNLRYVTNAYRSIRKHCGDEHEIIILDDCSTDGTVRHFEALQEYDDNLVLWENPLEERVGHTILYNVGADMASNDIFSIFHADMYASPGYVENILKHMDRRVVVSATRIEPPLHPEGKEKITRSFGNWPEDFDEEGFLKFVREVQTEQRDQTTRGIFAPWAMHVEDFLEIGGHDPLFAPFPYEDSDIFQRFILAGYEIVQSRDSLVYHLTCRGHKWTDDKQIGKIDNTFHGAERRARINFFRKWNSFIRNDEYGYPILSPMYDVGIILKGFNKDVHGDLASVCEQLYQCLQVEDPQFVEWYINTRQPDTMLDMTERITTKNITDQHDIIVEADLTKFTLEDARYIQMMNQIIYEWEREMGDEFELHGEYTLTPSIRVFINDIRDIKEDLVVCPRSHEDVFDV